jgi:hypothetical protein
VNQGPEGTPRELVAQEGPWPFTTRWTFRHADGSVRVHASRTHRKGLVAAPGHARRQWWHCLWRPNDLNWWIGVVFALGSLLFALGSLLSLAPVLLKALSLDAAIINPIFFAGSIPFTTAAYLQLFQAANAGEPGMPRLSGHRVWLGWRPRSVGWLSCALQFVGTLLFNANTLDALLPGLDWLQQDLDIWVPDAAGSMLFLASGYLAFIETGHGYWTWEPRELSWWITAANLFGCVAFMISAVFALVLPQPHALHATMISVAFTLLGALGFLVGSLLLLPEAD